MKHRSKTVYIAFLRGINVGGKNKVAMQELKTAFGKAGLDDVCTYINSGNVVFTSNWDETHVQKVCEESIEKQFGFHISVCILTAEELIDVLAHVPVWWATQPDIRYNAIMVIPPATPEDIFAEMGAIKPEYEKIANHGKVIFWSAPMETFSKTRYSSISKQATYLKVTIRNYTTLNKLNMIAQALAN